MYISPNYGGSHLMLLGGSAVQQAHNQMSLGQETLDLFNRPISSAQAIMDGLIEAFPENAQGPAARGSVTASQESDQAQGFDYDAWIDKTIAFQKAANNGLSAAATTSGATAVTNLVDGGDQTAADTEASSSTGSSTGSSGGTTSEGSSTGQTSGNASGNSTGGNSGGGLIGGLLGGLFGR